MASDCQEACQAARDENCWKLFLYNLTRKSKSWSFSPSLIPSICPSYIWASSYGHLSTVISNISDWNDYFIKTTPPPLPVHVDEPVPDFLLLKQTGKKTRHFRFPHVTDCFHQNCNAPRTDRSDEDDDDDGQFQLTISINILAKLSHEA